MKSAIPRTRFPGWKAGCVDFRTVRMPAFERGVPRGKGGMYVPAAGGFTVIGELGVLFKEVVVWGMRGKLWVRGRELSEESTVSTPINKSEREVKNSENTYSGRV